MCRYENNIARCEPIVSNYTSLFTPCVFNRFTTIQHTPQFQNNVDTYILYNVLNVMHFWISFSWFLATLQSVGTLFTILQSSSIKTRQKISRRLGIPVSFYGIQHTRRLAYSISTFAQSSMHCICLYTNIIRIHQKSSETYDGKYFVYLIIYLIFFEQRRQVLYVYLDSW